NVVHNLGLMQRQHKDLAFDWAARFDDAAVEQLERDPGGILSLAHHPDYPLAVPTPEHFIPLIYLAGLAVADQKPLTTLLRGYSMGAISMTCYGLDTMDWLPEK